MGGSAAEEDTYGGGLREQEAVGHVLSSPNLSLAKLKESEQNAALGHFSAFQAICWLAACPGFGQN